MALSFGDINKKAAGTCKDAYGLRLGHGSSRAERLRLAIDQYFENGFQPPRDE